MQHVPLSLFKNLRIQTLKFQHLEIIKDNKFKKSPQMKVTNIFMNVQLKIATLNKIPSTQSKMSKMDIFQHFSPPFKQEPNDS